VLSVEHEFEECLVFRWRPADIAGVDREDKHPFLESTVEMVIDRSGGKGPTRPAKDAMVKRVPMGREVTGCVQNMPDSRSFLISIVAKLNDGRTVRSPWTRASTLNPDGREKELGNLDPMSMPRLGCKECPCLGWVPQRWELNSKDKMRCRRCGCEYTDHLLVEANEILHAREEKAKKKFKDMKVTPLPLEAVSWDDRECSLWFLSEGLFHPRDTVGLNRPPLPEAARGRPGGAEGHGGRRGRVSVMTPTTESRQKFHPALWACFEAQAWSDKELVVVETYFDKPSAFLEKVAQKDPRLIYVKYKREQGKDWSIGLKRNMCAHLATGEFIANFDDDDIYAPSYLTTMVPLLADRTAHAVTLSSWFIFDTRTSKWGFCDAIAWGWQKGMDSSHQDVKNWAYGYGFSYVHRRQDLMDVPYDNINMGEDYSFVSRVLTRNGDKAVYLFHDEFGICLHTQHGGNTSNAFPVRDVSYEEAGYLDVADLPLEVVGSYLTQAGANEPVSGRGHRILMAHTLEGDVPVRCTAGVSVEEFLDRLEKQTGEDLCGGSAKVFRVPQLELTKELDHGTDEWMADMLGFKLEEPLGDEYGQEAHDRVRAEKERMMAKARRAMHIRDRISLQTLHLWVMPTSMVGGDEDLNLGEDQDSFPVEVSVQKTDAKSYFAVGNNITARLPKGSPVSGLRTLLGGDLPQRARILGEKAGRGMQPLSDDEPLPSRVTITEFKGSKAFYMRWSDGQCGAALAIMKHILEKKDMQVKVRELHVESESVREFGARLSAFLLSDVYPHIFRFFGMPTGSPGTRCLMDGMGRVFHSLELAELWLEVETLMKNATNIQQAEATLERLRAGQGAS